MYTLYMLFMYLWNHAFFMALPQFVIAGACVAWYFKKAVGERLGHPVCWALCSNTWRHLGSVAFGALILAIVEAIKLMFDYIQSRFKAASGAGTNAAVGCALRCIGCCIDCFERFIKFINMHAYI